MHVSNQAGGRRGRDPLTTTYAPSPVGATWTPAEGGDGRQGSQVLLRELDRPGSPGHC